jgi:hypothetical protein
LFRATAGGLLQLRAGFVGCGTVHCHALISRNIRSALDSKRGFGAPLIGAILGANVGGRDCRAIRLIYLRKNQDSVYLLPGGIVDASASGV